MHRKPKASEIQEQRIQEQIGTHSETTHPKQSTIFAEPAKPAITSQPSQPTEPTKPTEPTQPKKELSDAELDQLLKQAQPVYLTEGPHLGYGSLFGINQFNFQDASILDLVEFGKNDQEIGWRRKK